MMTTLKPACAIAGNGIHAAALRVISDAIASVRFIFFSVSKAYDSI